MTKITNPVKCKILIVEDDLLIARDIKEILVEQGYEVMAVATTVEEAITSIECHHPQIVLIDVHLNSGKDGTELGHYLSLRDTLPFIYITSYTDTLTLDRVKCTRPHGFIVKPFEPVTLIAKVEIVLHNYEHRKIDPLRQDNAVKDDIPYQIKKTILYIDQHLDEKIEVATLASLTRWKMHHFIRTFTQYVQKTPYQYILQKKIERSKALLSETSIPIVQISYEMGFLSYKNFYLAFKRVANMTPEAFRKSRHAIKVMEDDGFRPSR